MKYAKTTIIALMIGAIVATSAASAATVKATVSQDYKLTMATMIEPYDSTWYSGPTGRFMLTYSDKNPPDLLIAPDAFCIEVQTVSIGATYTYAVLNAADVPVPYGPDDTGGDPMGAIKADWLAELWGRSYSQVTDNVTGAAFALAVYEIVFEDLYVETPPGWDVLSGKFRARDDGGNIALAISQANAWLAELDGTGPKAQLLGLRNDTRQDFITVVPEPATLGLLAVGGLAVLRRRRK